MTDAAERARLVADLPTIGRKLRELHFTDAAHRCDRAAALLEADGLAGETEREKVVAFLDSHLVTLDRAENGIGYAEVEWCRDAIRRGEHHNG